MNEIRDNAGDGDAVAIHLTLTPGEFEILRLLLAQSARKEFQPKRHEAFVLGGKLFGDRQPQWET